MADQWEVYTWGNSAAQGDVSLDMDADGLSVEINGGYGYDRYTAREHVPMDVLITMLTKQGYVVTLPEEKKAP